MAFRGIARSKKFVLIIAGPNGSGKTSVAREFIPQEAALKPFVNADLIAAGLSPFDPQAQEVRSGRLMLEMIESFVSRGESFSFETTLSGIGYQSRIRKWKKAGYEIRLVFVTVKDADILIERIRQRVIEGGHYVAEEVVRRRHTRSIQNFERTYRNLADYWTLIDNTGQTPTVISEGGLHES